MIIGLIMGILGIVLMVAGLFTCFITCIIGIPLAIIGLIFFILAIASEDKQALPTPRICVSCGRQIDYYAQVCPWCGRDYRFPQYPPPPPPRPPPPPPPQQPI